MMYPNMLIDTNYVENVPVPSQLNRQQRRKTLVKIEKFMKSMAREVEILRISKTTQHKVAVAFYDEAYGKTGENLLEVFEKHKPVLSLVK